MKLDLALTVSILSLAVSTADFLVSRARSRRIEDRESVIEAKEAKLEKAFETLSGKSYANK
jgi:hypothetical protein